MKIKIRLHIQYGSILQPRDSHTLLIGDAENTHCKGKTDKLNDIKSWNF